jgi:UMF1 family MFS transporter
MLTIIGNAAYGTSIVCANAFLPGLAREDPAVQAAFQELEQGDGTDLELTVSRTSIEEDEGRRLLPSPIPELAAPIVSAISTADLAETPISPSSSTSSSQPRYNALLSLTTSRISSIGVALGFFAGVSVLALLIIPVTLMGGTTSSLRLAVGLSAVWWAVFTIPAWMGLPSGHEAGRSNTSSAISLGQGWRRVGDMIKSSEIRQLPNLFTFLLAWVFLSDGKFSPFVSVSSHQG